MAVMKIVAIGKYLQPDCTYFYFTLTFLFYFTILFFSRESSVLCVIHSLKTIKTAEKMEKKAILNKMNIIIADITTGSCEGKYG